MIIYKSDKEIEIMQKAGKLAADLLDMIEEHIKPGLSTLKINQLVEEYTKKNGAISAPLNYKGFPKSVCTSVNHVVCHGIPSSKQKLKDGDIINIDVTPILNGYHGDSSRTFFVGENIKPKTREIVECAHQCLMAGINEVKVGGKFGDIGAAIQAIAEPKGYGVVQEFVGHGIGKIFHEDPQVMHCGKRGTGITFKPGMTFTIEPMINEGDWRTRVLKDGWTAVTIDGGLSAQWEHTLAIKQSGEVLILTESAREIELRP